VSGVLVARKPDGSSTILALQSRVEAGDLLATAQDTYARVKFIDGSEVTLRPNSQLRIDAFKFDKQTPNQDSALFSLIKGGLRTITGLLGKRNPNSYEMRTVTATIGIRGTNYGLLLCQADCGNIRDNEGKVPQDGLHLDVADGVINVVNGSGEVLLSQGRFGYVKGFTTPLTIVPASQGVTPNIPRFPSVQRSGIGEECAVK